MKALRAEDATILDPIVFAKVVLAGIAAGESGGPQQAVSVPQVEADGSPSMLQVPDNPHSRAAFAIKREFPDDERAFRSALARFHALMNLFARDALGSWSQTRESGRTAMHPAVIDAACRMRLSANGHFAPRKFVLMVSEIAQQLYPDLEGW
jgi:hypothetical protein